tara:strand:+ start:404 stop:517 length:114 start_codon:yes stop_codon:yes gene_type:complete
MHPQPLTIRVHQEKIAVRQSEIAACAAEAMAELQVAA